LTGGVDGLHVRCDVAVVGSGFAGSILAAILARQPLAAGGRRSVALIERGSHPRFALGESSTPLAAIALERLAERYRWPELRALAAYGRWSERFPQLRRGLKRGFTFYAHRPGQPFANSAANENRLLVAASPNDALADAHWLRQDVDAELVAQAQAAGVEYLDETSLDRVEERPEGLRLAGTRRERAVVVDAHFVVDASGAGGLLATALPIPSAVDRVPVATALLAGHFRGARPFAEVAREAVAAMSAGPYPDDRAAVHHLLEAGWMYQLPFDLTAGEPNLLSAGFVLPTESDGALPLAGEPPLAHFRRLCAHYPSLARQLAAAEPVRPLVYRARAQHRLERAVPERGGGRWLVLPSTFSFTDPLFSTGIAWSLVGVERVVAMFEGVESGGAPEAAQLQRYGVLLRDEADWIDRLVAAAYRAIAIGGRRGDLRVFAGVAQLYFAAASFCEASQRLCPTERDWAWEGFLGCRDGELRGALDRITELLALLEEDPSEAAVSSFEQAVAAAIEPRNIAGLADPRRRNLYPVDFEPLVADAGKLGLTADQVRAALPSLQAI
jgi:FADH2 O2-dependent halogenase